MRNIAFIVLLVCAAGCEFLQEGTLSFTVDKDIPAQQINGTVTPCGVVQDLGLNFFQMPALTFSQEEDFPDQETTVDRIEHAYLADLTLALTAGSTEPNWDWMESLYVSVSAQDLPEVDVASVDPVPDGLTSLSLEPADTDLAPYVKAPGGFTLHSDATGCPPEQDVEYDGAAEFDVTARPL